MSEFKLLAPRGPLAAAPFGVEALVCPSCGEADAVERTLWIEFQDPQVECVCHRCDESWGVYLAPQITREA